MQLGEKMRHIREAKNLSQENVAEMLGMSVSGYAKLERGETDIPWSRVEQFSGAFNLRPWEVATYGEGVMVQVSTNHHGQVGYGFTVNNYAESADLLKERILRLESERDAARREVAHLEEIVVLLKK